MKTSKNGLPKGSEKSLKVREKLGNLEKDIDRVPKRSGNHGKPEKIKKKKFLAWKNHGIRKKTPE